LEYKLGNQDPSAVKKGKEALDQLLSFKAKGYKPIQRLDSQVQLLVPTYTESGSSAPIGEYVTRQMVPMQVRSLLPPSKDILDLDQLSSPQAIEFYEEHAYIVDRRNDRILKVRPGEEKGEIFFGGKGQGSGLDQLGSPHGITFYNEEAYIVDSSNNRILVVGMPQNQLAAISPSIESFKHPLIL